MEDAATKENGFGFDYLPKPGQDCSWTHIWDDMYNEKIKGMLAFGMNGVMIGPDTNKNINALRRLTGWWWAKFTRTRPAILASTRHYDRRTKEYQDHGLPVALRGLCRKRRQQ